MSGSIATARQLQLRPGGPVSHPSNLEGGGASTTLLSSHQLHVVFSPSCASSTAAGIMAVAAPDGPLLPSICLLAFVYLIVRIDVLSALFDGIVCVFLLICFNSL